MLLIYKISILIDDSRELGNFGGAYEEDARKVLMGRVGKKNDF